MKKIVIIEKDCDNWKGLRYLKKTVIIEKDYDNWKRIVIIEKYHDNWKRIVIIKKDHDNWKRIIIIEKDHVIEKIHVCNKMNFSSNINEVIRAVLSSFFLRKEFACTKSTKSSKKHQKPQKLRNATKQKYKNANKQTKIKNALKKHLRWKKSLTHLFAFLCFLCKRRKEN